MAWQSEIDRYREREREHRALAQDAGDLDTHDFHFVMAERYADRAWSLEEQLQDLAEPARRSRPHGGEAQQQGAAC